MADWIQVLVTDIQFSRWTNISSITIIVFDHILTFADEVEHIWTSKWNLSKIIFIITRYYTLGSVIYQGSVMYDLNLTRSACITWLRWQGITALISAFLAETILVMRLHALYFSNKKIIYSMLAVFLASTATAAYLIGAAISQIPEMVPVSLFGPTICILSPPPPHLYAFWIPIIINEGFLCSLALYRGWQARLYHPALLALCGHLIKILLRDSILYFLVLFAAYMSNLAIWRWGRPTMLEIPTSFSVALSCVMANRLILNVRKEKQNMDISFNLEENKISPRPRVGQTSEIHFAPVRSRMNPTVDFDEADIEMDWIRKTTPIID